MSRALLEVDAIDVAYGSSQVVFGVTLRVDEGQAVAVLGRNGMGKSTTMKAIMGVVAPRGGAILLGGEALHGKPAYRAARAGLGLVPEGRQIFPNLTVRENLVATAANRTARSAPWTLDAVYRMFPRLEERAGHPGTHLSGGEQQMLAIGRALMTNPRLLILDEATEGLAPLVRVEIWRALAALKRAGLALIVIDKDLAAMLPLADRHYVLEKGRVVWQGTSAQLRAQPDILDRHIGI